jgi:DNA-binding beta-propeller fold protein YncE
MKNIIALLILCSFTLAAQTPVQADITSAQAAIASANVALAQAVKDAAVVALPPVAAIDPIITALKSGITMAGTTLYADLSTCLKSSLCKVFGVVYGCPAPALWAPNTAYLLGAEVIDAASNAYRLTSINAGVQPGATAFTPVSGATITWNAKAGATTTDGPLTWTMAFPAGTTYTCASAAVNP